MLATIEIDLNLPAAEIWEPIAWRLAKAGENYFLNRQVRTAEVDHALGEVIIVRRKWTWPSWLKARWYAEDADGSQWGYMQKPGMFSDRWETDGVTMARFDEWFEIPKIGGDWRQSLRENPNWRSDNGQKDT